MSDYDWLDEENVRSKRETEDDGEYVYGEEYGYGEGNRPSQKKNSERGRNRGRFDDYISGDLLDEILDNPVEDIAQRNRRKKDSEGEYEYGEEYRPPQKSNARRRSGANAPSSTGIRDSEEEYEIEDLENQTKTSKQTRRRRAQSPSDEQRNYLISYMEKNTKFSQGEFKSLEGRSAMTREWKKLKESLDIVGGAEKNVEQWQQYWRDQKKNAKKAASAAYASVKRKTGGGNPEALVPEYYCRVLTILGGWKRIRGHTEVIDPLEAAQFSSQTRRGKENPSSWETPHRNEGYRRDREPLRDVNLRVRGTLQHLNSSRIYGRRETSWMTEGC